MDIRITLIGATPLVMHNIRLADPLDPATRALRAVTSRRKKTDDDHAEAARLEFLGCLYLDPDLGPHVPGENIERCLTDAAKITRQGRALQQALFVKSDVNPIAYTGPRDPDGLWADANYRLVKAVRVSNARVMRTRPLFRQWAVEADAVFDSSIVSVDDLRTIAETAGSRIGLGECRPRYGRFTAEIAEQ
jgi:hypothetical protein